MESLHNTVESISKLLQKAENDFNRGRPIKAEIKLKKAKFLLESLIVNAQEEAALRIKTGGAKIVIHDMTHNY